MSEYFETHCTDWKLISDQKIGVIVDVRFNAASNKILATERFGNVLIIDVE